MILMALAAPLCGCKKAKLPSMAKAEPQAVVKPTLVTEAAKLGLAGRVPADVAFCVSNVQWKRHLEALKASNWWKQMAAFVEDQLPAADSTAGVTVDEAFVAFGKDSVKGIVMLRQLNDLYNETAYRGMMSGGMLKGLGTQFDAAKMIEAALGDAQVMEALILWLERFEMPSVMIGVASPEPEKVLQKLSNELRLAEWLGNAPQSRIVTTQGEQITVNVVAMSQILTTERRRAWMEALPPLAAEMKDRIARGIEVLAQKKWVLAMGLGKDRAYLAVAPTIEQVRLATAAEDSMLSRPEMRHLDGNALKNLGLIACWDGEFLSALQSDEPFQPMVHGLLAGVQQEPTFASAARALQPLVVELAAAERACYHGEYTNGAGVAWWDGGLQAEWAGGVSEASTKVLSQPSALHPVLEEPALVFGMSGQSTATGKGRVYFEAWMSTAHVAAVELIKAGVGGEQAAGALKLAEAAVLPEVVAIYDGTKTIWQKGLGGDGAFVLDVGGKMPALPGLPPGGQEVPLPRLAVVQEMKNRELLGVSWQNIETAAQKLVNQLPLPQPFELPKPIGRERDGVTSHSYALPFESEDLVPCVSLTERWFMMGTSRAQQNQMAKLLRQPAGAASMPGMRVRAGFAKLREFLKTFATARGGAGGDVSGLKTLTKWLEPLETMDLRIWGDGSVGRGAMVWKMHDVLSYD